MFCAIRTADAIAKQSSKTWRTGNPKFDCHHYSGAEIRISPNYTCIIRQRLGPGHYVPDHWFDQHLE
jgi:hypothetical protein